MKAEHGLRQLMERMQLGVDASRRLLAYLALLEKWNARVNLTASVDWEAVGPLFQEGLWAAGFCGVGEQAHLDIGSGAGFPAMPMAALRPDIHFELVESRSRRAVFLEVAARELGLTRVRVVERRLGEYLAGDPAAGGWDVVSWKAVKLGRKDAAMLLTRAPAASFWVFHGAELPVEDEEEWSRRAASYREEAFPARSGWYLSMFHVKQ